MSGYSKLKPTAQAKVSTQIKQAEKPDSDLELKINEIFHSLQGESSFVGFPTVFIRLTGCPLRCQYCDTEYAFYEGSKQSISKILATVDQYQCSHITVTGGEPLAQKNCRALLTLLCDQGYTVSLETSGAMDISDVDHRVICVMDIKTPGSGEETKNRYENLSLLKKTDEIKFVICHRQDFEWSWNFIQENELQDHYQIFFSPSYGELNPEQLANWILEDQIQVRFQLQLHKQLWGDIGGK